MAEETTRIINLTEATETDSGMYFVTDSSNGTKKVSIETLIDSTLEEELAAAPAKSVGDNKADIETLQGQMETKAEIDGAYESMTVGNAEQLVSTVFSEDSQPYQFRPSGGSLDIGDREYDVLVGGSLVWNQIAELYQTYTIGGLTYTNNNDGSFTIDGTATEEVNSFPVKSSWISGHVYIWLGLPSNVRLYSQLYKNSTWVKNLDLRSQPRIRKITDSADANRLFTSLLIASGTSFDNETYYPMEIDLTTLFGSSTIPDYIYSLEQSTAGSGIAWLKKYLPKLFEYNAYTTPTIRSVENVSAHEFVGFNQWDEEWELGRISDTGEKLDSTTYIRSKNFIRILPNTTYYRKSPNNIQPFFYDGNMVFVSYGAWGSNATFVTPDNAEYMLFHIDPAYGTTYNHDININFHYDGERDGEYEPYKKWSYPISPAFGGHGIPKLDASGNLYFDGDRRHADGTVETRYGIVDLGTLTWSRLTTNTEGKYRFSTGGLNDVIKKPASLSENGSVICAKYITISGDKPIQNIQGIAVHTNGDVLVYDESLATVDANAFATAMSGTYLIYELATPTTSETSTFQSPQKVDDRGTERYVTDGVVPVGHETKYAPNLRAKLEMAPDSPSGDGDYIVRQTSGINTYAPLVKELPTKPSEDGTYTLKCTVSSGTATLSWEVEE